MHPTRRISSISELGSGDHVACIYESEEEHRQVMTPFIRSGLERKEKVLYITDVRTEDCILEYLADDGIDAERYVKQGQLAFAPATDTYLQDGFFDPEGMLALAQSETDRALEEGYAGMRYTSEPTWVLREPPGSDRFMEYEARLNEFFHEKKCMALCQYDRWVWPPEVLLNVISTHPTLIRGATIQINPFYVPPNVKSAPAVLKTWLDALNAQRDWDKERATLQVQLSKRVKERDCLSHLALIGQDLHASEEGILRRIAEALPEGLHHPRAAVARIRFGGREYRSRDFQETPVMDSADIFVGPERAGTVDIGYLTGDDDGEQASLADERVLLDSAAGIIGITLERKAAERQLKETLERLETRERERGGE
jgi:hypothetical protein